MTAYIEKEGKNMFYSDDIEDLAWEHAEAFLDCLKITSENYEALEAFGSHLAFHSDKWHDFGSTEEDADRAGEVLHDYLEFLLSAPPLKLDADEQLLLSSLLHLKSVLYRGQKLCRVPC